jgi:hypothetical protein
MLKLGKKEDITENENSKKGEKDKKYKKIQNNVYKFNQILYNKFKRSNNMARKKCKKRKVRRKARKSKKCKSRKCRSRKGRKRKSSKRKGRKGRRRNPGNFVKPSPAVAKRHVAYWSKKGVASPAQITMGMKGQYGAKTDTSDLLTIARVRLGEAIQISEAYDSACDKIQATKKVVGAFKCPINASSVAKYIGTGGNFRPVSKKRAIAYLKRLFRWSPRLHPKDAAGKTDYTSTYIGEWSSGRSGSGGGAVTAKQLQYAAETSVNGWLKAAGRRGDIGPRLIEAMIVVGADKAQKLLVQAQKSALAYAKKEAKKEADKAARKAKRDEAALVKIQAAKVAAQARLDKAIAKLNAQEAKLTQATAVASRKAKARKAKRAKRSRRRNPVRRRKAKRSMKRRAKKSKRRAKKSKRSRKAKRKSKKAKKSKRKSRKSRRRR